MGYEENRAAAPFAIRPFRFLRIVWGEHTTLAMPAGNPRYFVQA